MKSDAFFFSFYPVCTRWPASYSQAHEAAEAVFNGRSTKVARKVCPERLWRIAGRKLDQLDSAAVLEEFLLPMEITQRELADAVNVSYQRINEIVNGKRGITSSTALQLAKFFGVSADF